MYEGYWCTDWSEIKKVPSQFPTVCTSRVLIQIAFACDICRWNWYWAAFSFKIYSTPFFNICQFTQRWRHFLVSRHIQSSSPVDKSPWSDDHRLLCLHLSKDSHRLVLKKKTVHFRNPYTCIVLPHHMPYFQMNSENTAIHSNGF